MDGPTQVNTMHTDMVHDSQPDYYSKRIATCSSDKTIKIHEWANDISNYRCVSDLKGHEGPVWQVSWAHPKFGVILASCGYDRKVIIWKETTKYNWSKIYCYEGHELSVNSVAFAPAEFGLCLACGSSDGTVSVLSYNDGKWEAQRFQAHQIGVNAVSWAPAVEPTALLSTNAPAQPYIKRFATAGCDNLVKIWRYSSTENQWKCEDTLKGHKDWVRDVAWAPSVGMVSSTLASCSQDKTVIIWTQEDSSKPSAWDSTALPSFPDVVWRVSWSITGNILAVSGGDNKVSLWQASVEAGEGKWKCISSLEESGAPAAPSSMGASGISPASSSSGPSSSGASGSGGVPPPELSSLAQQ
ncbi:GTPase-activating protein S13 [Balamuthia mandrillaris]